MSKLESKVHLKKEEQHNIGLNITKPSEHTAIY
jgi:hypothetical protein